MRRSWSVDVVVVGAGVAGLWLLNRLRALGYTALLLEKQAIGGEQSLQSQGIIHGGLKFALSGKATAASLAIQGMPQLWENCLSGAGEIDLRAAKRLSSYQYLWSPGGIGATVASFFASKALRARVQKLAKKDYPPVFQQSSFSGVVYRLQEPVLDVASVIRVLATPLLPFIIQGEVETLNVDHQRLELLVQTSDGEYQVNAKRFIATAGAGNEALAAKLGFSEVLMQRRPLQMVYLRAKSLPLLYAHCMQASSRPRVTVTTHVCGDETVWYCGGDLAETGVHRSAQAQQAFAQKELAAVLPGYDFSQVRWGSFFIDRAEKQSVQGQRPDEPGIISCGACTFAWPTKLAFAPELARRLIAQTMSGLSPSSQQPRFALAPAFAQAKYHKEGSGAV
jgi:glycine/D-amino acid oxidase-like deaminating enzyme